MFSIGLSEIVVIALLALFLLKPEQLPEIAKKAGEIYGGLLRAFRGVKDSIEENAGAGAGENSQIAAKKQEKQ